jgi:hypothetical protein
MLGPGRYLLGVGELVLLGGFAWLGATQLRARSLPAFTGAPGQLATLVIAVALLLWTAELLGAVSLFEPLLYLLVVVSVGLGIQRWLGGGWGHPSALLGFSPGEGVAVRGRRRGEKQDAAASEGRPHPPSLASLVALVIAAVAVAHFAAGVKTKLGTGMTGFDGTWYHGPFAAGLFQSGDTWDLHFIAPQFLAWFYPANGEIFHAVGMLAFGRDLVSPLLNLGWFIGCLLACWCIGRPYRVAPWSLALGAVALSVPALHDQAGEARNDIVGIFFLLAGIAVALNAPPAGGAVGGGGSPAATGPAGWSAFGPYLLVGLSAGLAAGTKLNFLLPAAVLVLGLVVLAPRGTRWRALAAAGLAALAGGGYWYLRNLAHVGNPLPWVHRLGPISLPVPQQGLGGREAHSVLSYLTDGSVWSDWFLPGLHHGFWLLWPLLLVGALAGLVLALRPARGALAVAGLVGFASALAWLIAPTSASGPEGMPRGFESGLRYLAPALVLGLALLPAAPPLRARAAQLTTWRSYFLPLSGRKYDRTGGSGAFRLGIGRTAIVCAFAAAALAIAVGYPVQRHYLQNRYADPSFAAPGLNAAFKWARNLSNARIATTSTRQYPLFGTDLSNHVQFVGEERPRGGFEAPATCPAWRRLLNQGHYDYVVTTRDRIEPGKPPYPPTAEWTKGPWAQIVLKKPPTVVYRLRTPLPLSSCGS